MKAKFLFPVILVLLHTGTAMSQTKAKDSLSVVTRFKELLAICKNVDFKDSNVTKLGMFYKAAPYIVYHGEDKTRSWKDFANYSAPDEKDGVDNICTEINGSVNQDAAYKIGKYFTEKESEGTWHVLQVSYMRKGVKKNANFAFLKIGTRFGLGDID